MAALSGVDLRIEPGESIAIIGPSGAGKSTLFGLINLSLRPTSGEIWIDDARTSTLGGEALRRMRTRIATIHQKHDVVGRASVLTNVLAGRLGQWSFFEATRAWLWPRGADAREVGDILERIGFAEKLMARTDRLSGGQQQRVAIARAVFQKAEIVLADEPIASVDPTLAEDILSLLIEQARAMGASLLVSLHQVELARRFFPRLVGLSAGRIVFDRPAREVDDAMLTGLFSRATPEGSPATVPEDEVAPRPIDA